MKIAVPIFRERVSPVFDSAVTLLLVEVEDRGELRRTSSSLLGMAPLARAKALAELRVGLLICGAISRSLLMLVEGRGVRVIAWRCGEVEEVLRCYLRFGVLDDSFALPGCSLRSRNRDHRRGRLRAGFVAARPRTRNPQKGKP